MTGLDEVVSRQVKTTSKLATAVGQFNLHRAAMSLKRRLIIAHRQSFATAGLRF